MTTPGTDPIIEAIQRRRAQRMLPKSTGQYFAEQNEPLPLNGERLLDSIRAALSGQTHTPELPQYLTTTTEPSAQGAYDPSQGQGNQRPVVEKDPLVEAIERLTDRF